MRCMEDERKARPEPRWCCLRPRSSIYFTSLNMRTYFIFIKAFLLLLLFPKLCLICVFIYSVSEADPRIVGTGDWQGHSNNERAVWEGGDRDSGPSDIWNLVLPHSRTPLWSYTPRCICSWFSEGRGMGQRVILLKDYTRHPQRKTDREREMESGQKEEEEGGPADQRQYGEIRKQTGRDGDKSDRETESWGQQQEWLHFLSDVSWYSQPATFCNHSLSGAAWTFTRTFRSRSLQWGSQPKWHRQISSHRSCSYLLYSRGCFGII